MRIIQQNQFVHTEFTSLLLKNISIYITISMDSIIRYCEFPIPTENASGLQEFREWWLLSLTGRCKENLLKYGETAQSLEIIYIADVIDAVMAVLRYRGQERIFNIGNGHGTSLIDVAKTIEDILRYPLKINYKPAGRLHVPSNILDIDRAIKELGWKPVTPLQEGIRKVVRSLDK